MAEYSLISLSSELGADGVYISRELIKINEYDISKQLKRSSLSIGANIREAQFAESKKDFIHKMYIALKEANETLYWLKTIKGSSIIIDPKVQSMHNVCYKLIRMLNSSVKTAKNNLGQQ